MRVAAKLLLAVLVCTGSALVAGRAAQARTPTPTVTPTPTATATPSLTSYPTATPTLPPDQVARFSGQAWVAQFGGYDNVRSVIAKIGDTVCRRGPFCDSSGRCFGFPIDPPPQSLPYYVDVVPAEVKPGCGYEGAQVTFFINDEQARQTAIWHASSVQEVDLFHVPFAEFHGDITLPSGLDPSLFQYGPLGMYAYVNGNLCGEVGPGGIWSNFPYEEVVKSAEEQPGCGVEGAEVTFKLHDREGYMLGVRRNILGVAREKGVWHAWGDGNLGQELDLTIDPVGIALANVGDGGSSDSDATRWAALSLALSASGLLGIATAVVLRRRTAP